VDSGKGCQVNLRPHCVLVHLHLGSFAAKIPAFSPNTYQRLALDFWLEVAIPVGSAPSCQACEIKIQLTAVIYSTLSKLFHPQRAKLRWVPGLMDGKLVLCAEHLVLVWSYAAGLGGGELSFVSKPLKYGSTFGMLIQDRYYTMSS
jgi:hypothetical protein